MDHTDKLLSSVDNDLLLFDARYNKLAGLFLYSEYNAVSEHLMVSTSRFVDSSKRYKVYFEREVNHGNGLACAWCIMPGMIWKYVDNADTSDIARFEQILRKEESLLEYSAEVGGIGASSS